MLWCVQSVTGDTDRSVRLGGWFAKTELTCFFALRASVWSDLKCCFTSTETVGLLETGAQDVHLDFHTAPELCSFFFFFFFFLLLLNVHGGEKAYMSARVRSVLYRRI